MTKIHPLEEKDQAWAASLLRKQWGSEIVVSRGRVHNASQLPGFWAEGEGGARAGLVTYRIDGADCELVSINSLVSGSGIGTALVEAVKQAAQAQHCTRLWLITTNDNLDALRFYQRRGFRLAAVHPNALEDSRALKPGIPEIGLYGIPLRDEIELEMPLADEKG